MDWQALCIILPISQEAQAGADVLSGARDRDIRKTVGLRLYLMMERISTWMAAGAGLLFWVTKTMAGGDCCR
jgi:type IV secretory pathway TrbD component